MNHMYNHISMLKFSIITIIITIPGWEKCDHSKSSNTKIAVRGTLFKVKVLTLDKPFSVLWKMLPDKKIEGSIK